MRWSNLTIGYSTAGSNLEGFSLQAANARALKLGSTTADNRQMIESGASSRHTSGLTTRLILTYVERAAGRPGLTALLDRCGLASEEEHLRDERAWFDFQTKIDLFEAAAEVLADPDVARTIGSSVIDLNVLTGLKLALRAFGGPRTVYLNLPRSTGRFTRAHRLELTSLENGRARYRYHDERGVGYHRHDCQYSMGMLASVPTMFGHLPAVVRHTQCGVDGAPACVFDLTWDHRAGADWAPLGLAAAGAALALVSSRPRLGLPLPALGVALAARRSAVERRQQRASLEAEVRDEQEAGRRLTASLRDLVSERRIDDVLSKILESAQGALVGREFVLLVFDDDGVHCRSSSRVPASSLECLERWAANTPHVLDSPLTLDDLSSLPELSELAGHPETPLGALSVAPLSFRSSRLGALVALAHETDAFLPRETDLLETYAAEAAIAVANARLFERLERLARHDSLTGLLNHREFQEGLARDLETAQQERGRLSVILLDLDGFKRVNDEFGHAEGDRILRMAGDVIREACGGNGHAFRIGGDEFALVLPGGAALEAEALAVRIGAGIQALDVGTRASWGIAEWPTAGPSQSLVLFNADRALYEAKARGNPPRLQARDAPDVEVERRGLSGAERHRRGLTTALARAVDAKDSYTRSHSETVAELSALIAEEIGLDAGRVAKIRLAGLLHDVGKIGIADAILQKPGALTEDEFMIMKTHSTLGHSILFGAELFEEAEWILHHHERVDGRGYPHGLTGEEVPLESRVILVADGFEAMTSDRPYRLGRSWWDAFAELERNAGTQFDAECVRAIRRALSREGREMVPTAERSQLPSIR